MDWKFILMFYVAPIIILLLSVIIIGLAIRYRNNIKDFLRIGKTVQGVLEVADAVLPDTQGFTAIKKLIDDIVYSVEEISKDEDLSSEDKQELAKELYKEALEDLNLEESYSLSDNLLNALIKGSVFIMNQTILKEKKNEKDIENKILEVLEDISQEDDIEEDENDITEENNESKPYTVSYNEEDIDESYGITD